jgi:hypothetical protein
MRRLRQRRAAGLAPADGREPRDPDELIAPAIEETIGALKLGPADAGAAQLARRYAEAMDEAADPAWAARWIGPLLLSALTELRATPAARARAARGGKPGAPQESRLAQLRGARQPGRPGSGR